MRFLDLKAVFQHRRRRRRDAVRLAPVGELKAIGDLRARHLVAVRQPLVLVSQVHRSGGTLLSRLLDGHPQLYAIPHELGPLLPSGPVPLDPERAWELLYDSKLPNRLVRGLRQQRSSLNRDESRAELLLPPSLHRRLYDRVLRLEPPTRGRDMLDAYLTAYFNGWLNYRGELDSAKAWVAGFESELILYPRRLEQFRALYPDGRLISIVREPASWYASARLWDERYAEIGPALAYWERSVRATEQFADLVLDFDRLVGETETTMRAVAEFLDIQFDDALLRPTVNGTPFGANSSFESEGRGVVQATTGRGDLLRDSERREIERLARDTYERVRAVAA